MLVLLTMNMLGILRHEDTKAANHCTDNQAGSYNHKELNNSQHHLEEKSIVDEFHNQEHVKYTDSTHKIVNICSSTSPIKYTV